MKLSFRSHSFLLEDKVQWLKDNVKEIDSSHDSLAVHRSPDKIIDHIASADPHPKKAYTQWAVRQYGKGDFRQEDHHRLSAALSNFDKYKGKLDKKDINQYSSLHDLETATEPHLGGAASNKEEKRQVKSEGADLVHDVDGLKVHHLKTHEAACAYGAGTKWCTASKNYSGHFDNYSKQGPIYSVRTPDNEKYQFHFETDQFMNAEDQRQDLHGLKKKYPGLGDVQAFRGKHPAFDTRENFLQKAERGEKYVSGKSPVELDDEHAPILTGHHLESEWRNAKSLLNDKTSSVFLPSTIGAIIKHPNTPAHVIDDMVDVRPASDKHIAEYAKNLSDHSFNTLLRGDSMHQLASRDDLTPERIRAIVTANKNTSYPSAPARKDEVNEMLAAHPNTPHDILRDYAHGRNYMAALNALHNPSTPHEVHQSVYDADRTKHEMIASTPNSPTHLLRALTDHPHHGDVARASLKAKEKMR